MVKINSYIKDDIWKYSRNILTLITIYQNDFREENTALITKDEEIRVLNRKGKLDVINLEELKLFCKNEWRNLILKAVNEIKNEINFRKTRGMRFSDILIQLDKIKEDLVDITDYELEWFENTYFSDIKPLRQDTKERIDIEDDANKQRKKGYIYDIIIATIFFISGLSFQRFVL